MSDQPVVEGPPAPARRTTVTVSESIHVARPRADVFDFTQDYDHRSSWDLAVGEVEVVSQDPRAIRISVRGLGRFTVAYRLFRRPERTSAAFVDMSSRWVTGGGGSWEYVPQGDGTAWTQTNTLELRPGLLSQLLAPLVGRNLRVSMRRAMAKAKEILEAG
jgi:hypothetical protein